MADTRTGRVPGDAGGYATPTHAADVCIRLLPDARHSVPFSNMSGVHVRCRRYVVADALPEVVNRHC